MRGGSMESCIAALREVRSLVCFVIFGTLMLAAPVRFQYQRNIESILAGQSANILGDAYRSSCQSCLQGTNYGPS